MGRSNFLRQRKEQGKEAWREGRTGHGRRHKRTSVEAGKSITCHPDGHALKNPEEHSVGGWHTYPEKSTHEQARAPNSAHTETCSGEPHVATQRHPDTAIQQEATRGHARMPRTDVYTCTGTLQCSQLPVTPCLSPLALAHRQPSDRQGPGCAKVLPGAHSCSHLLIQAWKRPASSPSMVQGGDQ